MAYKVRSRLFASLSVMRAVGGAITVRESSGIVVSSIVELAAGQWQFDLVNALAATEENAAIQAYADDAGQLLNLPATLYTPDPLIPTRRVLKVTRLDGDALPDWIVWGDVQLYQIQDREQRAAA